MLCTDVVNYLVEKFGKQFRERRSQPPSAEPRHGQMDPGKQLVQPLGALGQDSALQHFVHWLAVIYKRWVGRGGESCKDFRSGVAYMALMCCPGPGVASGS